MTKEINLLPLENRLGANKKKGLALFRWVSFGSLVLIVILAMTTFVMTYFSPLRALKEQQVSLLNQFGSLNKRTAEYLYLKDRIGKIKTIIKSRKTLSGEMNLVVQELPSGVSLNSLSIDKDKVSVTVTADSLMAFNTFIDNLIRVASDKKGFSSISLVTLGLNPSSGSYTLTLNLTFL